MNDDIVSTTSPLLGLTGGARHDQSSTRSRPILSDGRSLPNIDREEKPLSSHWLYDRHAAAQNSRSFGTKDARRISEDGELLRFPLNGTTRPEGCHRDWDDKLKTTDAEFQEWSWGGGHAEMATPKR
jgi:hypothetical protein